MNKLYSIKTTDEVIRVPKLGVTHFDVTVNWFCKSRTMRVTEFCERELGWINVSGRLAEFAYQYFTESEVAAVINLLQHRFGACPEVGELYLPLSEIDTPFSMIPPEPEAGDNYGFVHVGQVPELSISLSGYYDKDYANVTPRFHIASVKSLVERSGLNPSDYLFN